MPFSSSLLIALVSFGLFVATWTNRLPLGSAAPVEVQDRVVISAPMQLLLAGGDRFLAANFETMRAVSAGSDAGQGSVEFRARAHRVVAELNACHEDNYYLGNAVLTWGGAVVEGNDLLRRAMECRTWDEVPAFFYGFNQFFFFRDIAEARRSLEIAANRSVVNAAAFRKLAIMIAAGEFEDEAAALEYLRRERDEARDPKLRNMLDKRVQRLAGLLGLREAQRRYEVRFGRRLNDPSALVETGFLKAIPSDPLGLGYEFEDGQFRMRELRVAGMENIRR